MDKIDIRPVTEPDIIAFFGKTIPRTVQGWSIDLNGELSAICGITIGGGPVVAFSEIKPGLDVPKVAIWRTAKDLMQRIKGLGFSTVYAVASPKIPGAPAFLMRLGFVHIESSVRGEVFRWQIH